MDKKDESVIIANAISRIILTGRAKSQSVEILEASVRRAKELKLDLKEQVEGLVKFLTHYPPHPPEAHMKQLSELIQKE